MRVQKVVHPRAPARNHARDNNRIRHKQGLSPPPTLDIPANERKPFHLNTSPPMFARRHNDLNTIHERAPPFRYLFHKIESCSPHSPVVDVGFTNAEGIWSRALKRHPLSHRLGVCVEQ